MIDWNTAQSVASVIESIATVIAIIIGGIWTYRLFIQNRERYSKARVTQTAFQKPLFDDKTLFHVVIIIENIGDTLIRLASGEVRLLQVLPLEGEAARLVKAGQNPVLDKRTDIDWVQLDSKKISFPPGTCEIEPGEPEEIICDFVVEPGIETVMVYSYIQNELKFKRPLGWSRTTLHDIEPPLVQRSTDMAEEPRTTDSESEWQEKKQRKPRPQSPPKQPGVGGQKPPQQPSPQKEKSQEKARPPSPQKAIRPSSPVKTPSMQQIPAPQRKPTHPKTESKSK